MHRYAHRGYPEIFTENVLAVMILQKATVKKQLLWIIGAIINNNLLNISQLTIGYFTQCNAISASEKNLQKFSHSKV